MGITEYIRKEDGNMAFKIVRNDITQMNTEAIVNTANADVIVGAGCDHAVYRAAGHDELLAYRKEKIGFVPEGDVFLTPGFHLQAKYIIHAVSPLYMGGGKGEEGKLRSCYRKSLWLAKEHGIRSVAFPLISTGSFGYPKEEGMRIAVDEINAFLLHHDMEIFLVVFGDQAKSLGKRIYPELEEYIDRKLEEEKRRQEYGSGFFTAAVDSSMAPMAARAASPKKSGLRTLFKREKKESFFEPEAHTMMDSVEDSVQAPVQAPAEDEEEDSYIDFEMEHESRLEERMNHISDTFSQYLMYLIQEKKMENADVYKRAIVDKKIFSKIKNNADYHPQKRTALCLCVGAKLNLDETKDLLARAGYALSPCDKTDIIFSYFIENGIYDMIELDIQLEEYGLPCIIS